MGAERDTVNKLVNYLLDRGYPQASLFVEWPAGDCGVDLSVIDPPSKELMALFKIKDQKTQENIDAACEQLQRYIKARGQRNIPSYLVFAGEGRKPLEINRINTSGDTEKISEVELREFSSFSTLRNSRLNALLAEKRGEQKAVSSWVWRLCWGLALFILILLFLDLVDIILIELNHLILLGGIAGLVLFPFIKKLRIAGVEIENILNHHPGNLSG